MSPLLFNLLIVLVTVSMMTVVDCSWWQLERSCSDEALKTVVGVFDNIPTAYRWLPSNLPKWDRSTESGMLAQNSRTKCFACCTCNTLSHTSYVIMESAQCVSFILVVFWLYQL